MKQTRVSEKGQALILIAAGILAMVLIVGLGVDVGNAFADRRQAQAAADTAALTAALARVNNQPWQEAGLNIAAVNGYTGVVVISPPDSGYYAGNPEYIQVHIVSQVPTTFSRVFNIMEITNRVHAVARAKPPVPTNLFDGHAMVSLAPHQCGAFIFQGNAETFLTGSGIFVNSDCPTAAFLNHSGSADLYAPWITVVGGAQYKAGSIHSTVTTGAQPYDLSMIPMPNPTCTETAQKTGNVLSPGIVTGSFPPNGVDTLESGVYCVYGNFRMNAHDTLVGEDVVIVMMSGEVHFNGGASIRLDAPDDGPFAGLLIYQPASNTSDMVLNGNSESSFTGTILAPGADIQVNGTGGVAGLHSQVIGYTLDINGTSDMTIIYNGGEQWITTEPAKIELAK